MGTYLRLLGTVRPYLGGLAGALLCMVLLAGTTAVYAWMVGPLLKFLITRGGEGGTEILSLVPGLDPSAMDRERMLLWLPLFILIVAGVKGISYFGQFYLMGMVGQRVIRDLRNRMFLRITELSPAFYHEVPTGQIVSRFTNDVYAIEQAVTFAVASYLRDTLEILALAVTAFLLDWKLSLIAFVVMPVAVFPIVAFGKRLKHVSLDGQNSLGRIADRLQEAIRGMRIIQVFGAEQSERRRFAAEAEGYFRIMRRSFAVRALQSPVMEFLGAAGLAATIGYAGVRVASGTLDPGHFISFFAAVLLLYNPIKSLGRMGDVTAAGVAAAERVYTLLDSPSPVTEHPGAIVAPPFQKELRFENVRFAYQKEEVLRGVNLCARRGEMVALVGPSGAGKSTLVNLIPRFYDVIAGAIRLDGRDIREFTLSSLRAQIGMVTQEVILFNDTVRANVCCGRAASDAALWQVLERANARVFVERLPQGLDTRIGEGGILLSGGERQRLAVARALLKNAPLLILDEATSALDTESEREVQAALEELMRERTTLVIAHRLSTVYRADRILVLERGTVVEEGSHEKLLAAGGLYRKLYDLQFADPAQPSGENP
ncbi:MAG: ATP-binding cassette domain-containing protein [Myxococcales bacterium]|nr:ATP-binding cassette domain-containing protein [Myxococcales bacterium]